LNKVLTSGLELIVIVAAFLRALGVPTVDLYPVASAIDRARAMFAQNGLFTARGLIVRSEMLVAEDR